jgi:hypothetical protein
MAAERAQRMAMRKVALLPLLLSSGLLPAAPSVPFRVHYSIKGSGRDITVQAESSAEASSTSRFPNIIRSKLELLKVS